MNKQEEMVSVIRDKYGLDSPSVLLAMLAVPREKFAPRKYRHVAYNDGPIPIGMEQTMSQPYTVAFMTDLLFGAGENEILRRIRQAHRKQAQDDKVDRKIVSTLSSVKDWKVLEIGTGSGYQAAILSQLVSKVYTVEIIDKLAKRAEKTLKKLKYKNVYVRSGSGEWGWKEHAPYNAIIVTCGVEGKVPQTLFDQLKVGGVIVVPVGKGYDKTMMKFKKMKKPHFIKVTRGKQGTEEIKKTEHGIFHFVPFIKEKK